MSCPWCWKWSPCLRPLSSPSFTYSDVPSRAVAFDHVKLLLLVQLLVSKSRTRARARERRGATGLRHRKRNCQRSFVTGQLETLLLLGGRLAHCFHSNTTETEEQTCSSRLLYNFAAKDRKKISLPYFNQKHLKETSSLMEENKKEVSIWLYFQKQPFSFYNVSRMIFFLKKYIFISIYFELIYTRSREKLVFTSNMMLYLANVYATLKRRNRSNRPT